MLEVSAGFGSAEALSAYGPTFYVRIGIDPKYLPGGPIPNLPPVGLPALVDTGASLSCVDATLAERLQLPLVDRGPVTGVHGSQETNFYAAQFYSPDLESVVRGLFAGLPLRRSGHLHYALIGRSFLEHFTHGLRGPDGARRHQRRLAGLGTPSLRLRSGQAQRGLASGWRG